MTSHAPQITLTLAELAARWNMTAQEVLLLASPKPLPMYFYYDGLVFDFGDKWLRANGDTKETQDLESHQQHLAALDIDLQRQALHKRGLLKLTQWEEALSDEELQRQQAEAERLRKEVTRLSTLLKERTEERQRHVRNGLLRAAPRTLHEIARHGETRFPQFAFLPARPEQPSDRLLVALEDGFPLKPVLTAADLVVAMHDVTAAEAAR
ncbi:hypothetical protein ASC94_06655 [Massilia sp. Root418]|jgi:hypothetical protein|uniref:hypothetical protein n=1 Tax=Massilia sp. Root418 TaxID=1736532 RepID=UPI0006FCC784|nr:hypothetical protein [Massilia sp. Root418]KQW96523.1 hypothetical protein ASC94_06655 [Massilia sp. Root418]